ncbi:hypothetical protein NITGR_1050017 [Nitrospina gracilis 3/211]|uniref:Uncharacterized protein n=1 Tax=Nitrospina gracilis (strain 3/211) TaxID=1266370 RepID=M1Z8R4_NITG3|nr:MULTISPECIES: hypothetical protein [Nitrospina]MCF8722255.1 hypothetical protein [Nitrospina sp. Nb-3]CCQ89454.1 hypothetical protein NITGR_1050017 [Nitrospina gracilis 3/211]
MNLYKAYSLIPSTRLTMDHEEDDIRIEWIVYFRDEPLPVPKIIANYPQALEMNEEQSAPEYLRWIQSRVNNLLLEEEKEELERYLTEKYGMSAYFEKMAIPIDVKKLPWFRERYINSMVILHERGDPFILNSCIVGMVSPFKNFNTVHTVSEFLQEIDRQNEV